MTDKNSIRTEVRMSEELLGQLDSILERSAWEEHNRSSLIRALIRFEHRRGALQHPQTPLPPARTPPKRKT